MDINDIKFNLGFFNGQYVSNEKNISTEAYQEGFDKGYADGYAEGLKEAKNSEFLKNKS